MPPQKNTEKDDKELAAIAYVIFPVPFLSLVLRARKKRLGPESDFLKFHTKQGSILGIFTILGVFILNLMPTDLYPGIPAEEMIVMPITGIASYFPIFFPLSLIIRSLFIILVFILVMTGFSNVLSRKEKELPIIGWLSRVF